MLDQRLLNTKEAQDLLKEVFADNVNDLNSAIEDLILEGKCMTKRSALKALWKGTQTSLETGVRLDGLYLGQYAIFGGRQEAYFVLTKGGVAEIRISQGESNPLAGVPVMSKVVLDGMVKTVDKVRPNTPFFMTIIDPDPDTGVAPFKWITEPTSKGLVSTLVQELAGIGWGHDENANKILVENQYYAVYGIISRVSRVGKKWGADNKIEEYEKIIDGPDVNIRLVLTNDDKEFKGATMKIVDKDALKAVYGVDSPDQWAGFFQWLGEAEPDDAMTELQGLEGKRIFIFGSGGKSVKGAEIKRPFMSISNSGFVMDWETLVDTVEGLMKQGATTEPAAAAQPRPPTPAKVQETIAPLAGSVIPVTPPKQSEMVLPAGAEWSQTQVEEGLTEQIEAGMEMKDDLKKWAKGHGIGTTQLAEALFFLIDRHVIVREGDDKFRMAV